MFTMQYKYLIMTEKYLFKPKIQNYTGMTPTIKEMV